MLALLTICSLMRFPSTSIVRILKSIPIVVMNDGVHESSQKRRSKHDLPTPVVSAYIRVLTRVTDQKQFDKEVVMRLGHDSRFPWL